MYLRIYALLCCGILTGFVTTAQNTRYGPGNDGAIDIDDLEGSGRGPKDSTDTEASGSGVGPFEGIEDDDEDRPISVDHIPKLAVPPRTNDDIETPPPVAKGKNDLDTLVPSGGHVDQETTGVLMNPKSDDRPTSFFAQPGILAAVIGGAVVGLLCAILVVMFIVYRMRKKDEGSYALDEPKRSPTANTYSRGASKEFFA